MTDIVKVLDGGTQVYPQTHANAVIGLEEIEGAQGPQGPAGTAATITVGTVTSGTTASVTNAGTSSAAEFNFVLPKGDKGEPGTNATTTAVATTTANGLMSSSDKEKLDLLANITFEKVGTV